MGEYFGFISKTESTAGFGLDFIAESKAGFWFGFNPKPWENHRIKKLLIQFRHFIAILTNFN